MREGVQPPESLCCKQGSLKAGEEEAGCQRSRCFNLQLKKYHQPIRECTVACIANVACTRKRKTKTDGTKELTLDWVV